MELVFFLTIMAAPVDKSGVSPSVSHNNDLYMLERHLFQKDLKERQF